MFVWPRLDLTDTARLTTLVMMSATEMAASLAGAGHMYVMAHSASSLTAAARVKESMSGITQVSVHSWLALATQCRNPKIAGEIIFFNKMLLILFCILTILVENVEHCVGQWNLGSKNYLLTLENFFGNDCNVPTHLLRALVTHWWPGTWPIYWQTYMVVGAEIYGIPGLLYVWANPALCLGFLSGQDGVIVLRKNCCNVNNSY